MKENKALSNIQLDLSVEEINLILKALGNLPFNEVYDLIGEINNTNLELSIDNINIILKALGNLPFNQVYNIIGKIHDQANRQV